jgi:hypothetical protein
MNSLRKASGIPGVTKTSLWNAWKAVRRQLKRAPCRDILDYLEYDIDPDVWITRLLDRLRTGEYTPERPNRYSLAKSKGFDRIITVPAIPDLVLYRMIVDHLFRRAKRKQKKHVYFCQATMSKSVASLGKQAGETMQRAAETDYETSSTSAFLEWLKYDQYRKLLIFAKIYPFIVVTDITNFFDSILYGRIEESLYDIPAPPRMVMLLFSLLESLSIRETFTPVQRIGLPVDPCDCSRNLAHMALFPHDERMVDLVGEDAYVRWMDDQNIGVNSYAEGLRVLSRVGDSLRRLHLTANAGKSRILSLEDAREHFHFNSNRRLDRIERMPCDTPSDKAAAREVLERAWKVALKLADQGEWEKVLKRFYRHAARTGSRVLTERVVADLKAHPALVDRIADYVRYVGRCTECIDLVEQLLSDQEQVYGDINYRLLESVLRLEPNRDEQTRIRQLAQRLLNGEMIFPGVDECRVLAPLLLLRFGDLRNLKGAASKLERDGADMTPSLCRSLCAVVSSMGQTGFRVVEATASRLLRNHISEFVKLVTRIKEFRSVPGRFRARIDVSFDSITGAKFFDIRSILAVRILALCPDPSVYEWLNARRRGILSEPLSAFDKRLIAKLWPAKTVKRRSARAA